MTGIQTPESDDQQALGNAKSYAAVLYRLAYLLTGDRGRSLDATLETLDSDTEENPFFASWMGAWSRRVVIAKVLSGIRGDLTASARRTQSIRAEKIAVPSRDWAFDTDTDGACVEMERALLAIDLFPRCAVLLTMFEGVPLKDAAVLLDADEDLIRKGQMVGLRELTRNLAAAQGWKYTARRTCPLTCLWGWQQAAR